MNYYQFHIADFALHTSHLTLEEEAVYRRLLDYYYDTEQPIPNNPEKTQSVIRRLRLGSYSDIVKVILREFFVLKDGFWHNLRADIEIADFHKKADRARANGKKGGRPKKQAQQSRGEKTPLVSVANPQDTESVPVANPEKTGSKANQEPRTINQEPLTNTPCSPPEVDPAAEVFEFWCSVMGKDKKTRFTDGRRAKVRKRLENFSVEDIKLGIIGCASSDHHMGKNPRSNPEGVIYDDLTLICRSDEKLDSFIQRGRVARREAGKDDQLEAWIREGQGQPVQTDIIEGELV